MNRTVPEHFELYAVARALPRWAHDDLMAVLATFMRAKNIVELGTGPGFATRVFRDVVAKCNGHLWSVDKGVTEGREGLEDDRHVTFITSDTVAYAAVHDEVVDLVYVDSDHSYAHVLAELRAWAKHRPRAMFVDDTLDPNDVHGSPLEAAVNFCTESGWRCTNIPIGTGLCILLPPEIP